MVLSPMNLIQRKSVVTIGGVLALTIPSEIKLEKENLDLKSIQAQRIERLEEEIERNWKAIDHNSAMMKAIKGALDAKSKASFMAMKDSLGWKQQ